jgi:hypothetical protein
MRTGRLSLFVLLLLGCAGTSGADAGVDWLIAVPNATSQVITTAAGTLLLSNGLVSREFALKPAFGTIDWTLNATSQRGGAQSMFRAVMAEGRLTLDNATFDIGGLAQARTFRAYCNRSDFTLAAAQAQAFRYVSHRVGSPVAPFPWTPGTRHSPPEYQWPPRGTNLAVVFAAPAASAYRDFMLTVHYEIYDGLPLISKWWTLAQKPGWNAARYAAEDATASPPPPPPPLGPAGTLGGWRANAAGHLFVRSGDQLTLELRLPGGSSAAGAAYLNASDSMGLTLGQPLPSRQQQQRRHRPLERQMSFGLGLSASGLSREEWEVFASCDSGGLYVGTRGGGRPSRICACKVGDTLAVALDRHSHRVTVSANGVAMGWATITPAGAAAPLHPRVQILPTGYTAQDLHPAHGLPPPPPPPPPAPPASDAVVSQATVELFGAMPRFGTYPGHGSRGPGQGIGAGGVTPSPLLQVRTDQAHGAQCQWMDGEPSSGDNIPGCSSCKDEGAVEPYLNCSYSLGPGAHVNARESFTSFRVMSLATDSDDVERQALAGHRTTQLLAPHTTENPIFFHATDVSETGFRATIDQMAETGFEMLVFSFGSGFRLESADPTYLATIKAQIDYAHSKGIEVGGYDLICLDRGNPGAKYGEDWSCTGDSGEACFASGWYDKLSFLVHNFINSTGLSMLYVLAISSAEMA